MPRIPRGHEPDAILHIINRGVERRVIFAKTEDYAFFMTQVKVCFELKRAELLSYCLMPNHFHLMAAVSSVSIGEVMHLLQTRHSLYFNRVYERVGHLFQNRFKAFRVLEQSYVSQLPVYIHMNPVRAGLVSEPSQWEWSGHGELMSGSRRFLDLSRLEVVAGISPEAFRDAYVECLRAYGARPGEAASIQEIAEWSARKCGIRLQDLLEGGRGGPYTRAKIVLLKAAKERGFTLADVAGYLRCAPSGLQALDDEEKGRPF
ncbi:MAG: transposase [Elusimicrobiota bacterium]|nr:transposase [Elusimicrobiota bacterium]